MRIYKIWKSAVPLSLSRRERWTRVVLHRAVRTLTTTLSLLNIVGKSIARKQSAMNLRLMGDKLNDMWNVVQNHHADNSLTLEHPVFSKIRRAWFSTVRSEINRRFAISFLLAPHANNSAISDSRLVSFTASIIKPPTRLWCRTWQTPFPRYALQARSGWRCLSIAARTRRVLSRWTRPSILCGTLQYRLGVTATILCWMKIVLYSYICDLWAAWTARDYYAFKNALISGRNSLNLLKWRNPLLSGSLTSEMPIDSIKALSLPDRTATAMSL